MIYDIVMTEARGGWIENLLKQNFKDLTKKIEKEHEELFVRDFDNHAEIFEKAITKVYGNDKLAEIYLHVLEMHGFDTIKGPVYYGYEQSFNKCKRLNKYKKIRDIPGIGNDMVESTDPEDLFETSMDKIGHDFTLENVHLPSYIVNFYKKIKYGRKIKRRKK